MKGLIIQSAWCVGVCVKRFLSAAAKLSLEPSGMWAWFRAGAVWQLPVLVTCSEVSVRCSVPEP